MQKKVNTLDEAVTSPDFVPGQGHNRNDSRITEERTTSPEIDEEAKKEDSEDSNQFLEQYVE